jgi:hypothetical protein
MAADVSRRDARHAEAVALAVSAFSGGLGASPALVASNFERAVGPTSLSPSPK